jgi:DNA primase
MDFQYELSDKWKSEFEMPVPTREEMYKEEVISTLNYLKIRKIKRMIEQNQQDLQQPHSAEEQIMLIQTHQHLKQMERELLQQTGTVIVR